ncbi:galactosylceramide sulfotransferase-like [Glandiceps talaboti]
MDGDVIDLRGDGTNRTGVHRPVNSTEQNKGNKLQLVMERKRLMQIRGIISGDQTAASTVYDKVMFTNRSTCPKSKNVVFLKTHKTGSETMAQIFLRYGDINNLSIVLPSGNWSLGWPWQLQQKDYLPPSKTTFNLLCLHTVYNKTKMSKLMPVDTKFVTILRDPWQQFKSSFNYFHWIRLIDNSRSYTIDPLKMFLKSPDNFYKWEKEKRVPYIRNFMAFDLGFPPSQYDNVSAIIEFINGIQQDFELVMIMEYFDESLLLLKRILCWDLIDILFIPLNVRKQLVSTNDNTKDLYTHFGQADIALYDHFKKQLLIRITQEPDFNEELKYFRHINSQFKYFCGKVARKKKPTLTIAESKWNNKHIIDEAFCMSSRLYIPDYINVLKQKLHGITLHSKNKPYLWPIKR